MLKEYKGANNLVPLFADPIQDLFIANPLRPVRPNTANMLVKDKADAKEDYKYEQDRYKEL